MSSSTLQQVFVGRLKVNSGWKVAFGMHTHGHVEVMLMLGGRLRVQVGGETVEAGKGDALFYAPGVPHLEEASPEGADFLFFNVPASQRFSCKPLVKDPGRRLLTLAYWISEEREKPFEKRDRIIRAYVDAVIIEMEKLSEAQQISPLSHIRDHMMGTLTKSHSIGFLAKRAGMSKYHFIRSYKKCTGLTPMQDLLLIRLEAACNLLTTTEMTLKQVAEETGFCDEYYFSRMFRKQYGTTPGAFRHGRS
ncbi:MAG TPA: hypothetical protein DCZ94_14905 [Lentisphaeria bacterium]|nr:MAG: hypothetical protein A2X48_03060 [Lentisphaerae bacterium GWF2_49_21]HBC88238.1 hypothetical protein [Lentisphaeria bacterium]